VVSLTLLLAAESTTDTHLEGNNTWFTLLVVVGFVLAAGGVVAWGRRWLAKGPEKSSKAQDETSQSNEGEGSLVRSWLAISLVGGLLIFTAISFWINDPTMRSTLIGGLVANAGAAVAFYFASLRSPTKRGRTS
jgi:high-affinity Fe2+/Pb2+ permease